MKTELAKDLAYLGLMDKAREIYDELGDQAALSYIKNSHRLLSKVYHPDLNPGNKDSEQKFKEVNEAYSMIGTKEAREKFDKGGFIRTPEQYKNIVAKHFNITCERSFRNGGCIYYSLVLKK